MPVDAVMYRHPSVFRGYAIHAGLAQMPVENLLPLVSQLGAARQELVANLPAQAAPYLAEHVRFFVLGPDDNHLAGIAEQWLLSGEAIELTTFGTLRVIELRSANVQDAEPTSSLPMPSLEPRAREAISRLDAQKSLPAL